MNQPVVLLHGLGRTRLAMIPLAMSLKRRGFEPINVGYFGPGGLQHSLGNVSKALSKRLARYGDAPVHFVTHSMGGIVARTYLSAHPRAAGGRLVQLAPPNQGSALANAVRRIPLMDKVPALQDLGATASGLPTAPPSLAGYEVGVVAGRSRDVPWHDAPSDGVVRVAETHLPEAVDWILVDAFHTLVMNSRAVWDEIETFLNTGRFGDAAARLEHDEKGRVVVRSAQASETTTL